MKRILSILLIAVLALGTLACIQQSTQAPAQTTAPVSTPQAVTVEVDEVSVPVTELIVTNKDQIPTVEALSGMTSLRLLDLTALAETPYETVSELLPVLRAQNCRVLWNQKLTDGVFRSDSAELTLPNATAEDLAVLEAFSDLRTLDATGSTAYAALNAYKKAHPNVAVQYVWYLGENAYPMQTEAVTVPDGIDPSQFIDDLQAFENVKEIDLKSSNWDMHAIESLRSARPDIHVISNMQIGDQTFDSEAELLDLRETLLSPDRLIEVLSAFSSLKTVALPSAWTIEDRERVQSAYPALTIVGTVEAYGRTIDGGTEELDLSKTKIASTEEVELLLGQLPFIRKLVLCECGLTNEQMESLLNAHPDVKFIWTIEIGKRKLRTDAIGFSTKNPSKYTNPNSSDKYNESVKKAIRLKEGDIEALKYCTDLEALDLGHNYLTNSDLAVISKLTKLKVLILADNKITDISALTALKDLEYIELFMNRIPDLAPLTEMPSLVDVNVCNVGASDLTPLFELTGCKRLWYAMNPFNREQAKQVKEALPDCVCNYTTRNETAEGWREDPRYQWMRAYFQDN